MIKLTVLVRTKGIDDTTVYNSSPFEVVTMRGHSWKKYGFYYAFYYLWKYLRQHPNAVIIASNWLMARAAVKLKSKFNPFVITAAHGMEITRLPFQDKSKRREMEAVIHGSNAVIAVSNFTNSQIHRLCQSKPTNTHFIPNGTDIEYFKPIDKNQEGNLREKYNFKKTSLILLTLARVIPRKGHDVVIKALPQIVKVIPNIIYVIAGPENLKWKRELTKIASELRVENHIRFLGYVTDQEKLDLYQICDTYIMVSKNADLDGDSEGFGITFLEANACGKPVIGSNTGGIPDAVENSVSGLLVEPNNVDQTVEAIIKLLSNYKLRTKMGELARKRVENHFTWDHVVTRIRDLIDNRAFI